MSHLHAAARSEPSVGALLTSWRKTRQLSQLALALAAGVSSRHLCFVETGRAKPSRDMILLLAETLDVPLRERNALLLAAGLAPEFAETPLDAPELAVVQRALDAMLAQHEPFPAVVMNRHWDIVRTNRAATQLFDFLLAGQSQRGLGNVLRLMFHPEALKPFVLNWEEVAVSLLRRLQRELVGGIKDVGTEQVQREILAYPGVPAALGRNARTAQANAIPILPVVFRRDTRSYEFFSTVTTLGTPQDVTAQEIRLECFFPANQATAERARSDFGR